MLARLVPSGAVGEERLVAKLFVACGAPLRVDDRASESAGEGLPNSERSRRLLSFGVILHTPRSSNSTRRSNSSMGGRVVSDIEPKPTPSTHRRSLRALLTAPLVAMRWSHSAQKGSRSGRRADIHHDTHSTPLAKGHAAVGSSPLQAATHTQMWL